MSQNQPSLLVAQPIIRADGTMSDAFRTHMQLVSRAVKIVGTGSPEGVLEAPQYSEYIDETVPAVPVRYLKMLTDIGGDGKQGWAVG